MKLWKPALMAFAITGAAGLALGQDIAAEKRVGRPALADQPSKAKSITKTYGITNSSYYRMGANEFTGMQVGGPASADAWTDTFYTDATAIRRYPQVGSGWFVGTPHLPSGAIVKTINIEDCVADGPNNSLGGAIYACDNDGNNCAVLAAIDSGTGCGYDIVDISSANYVVDNSPTGNYLVIWIQMLNTDGSDNIAGASIEYQLQVSPAPAVATFLDVPTSSPQFQYVEALVAAGITAGCGAPNYCPNNPVTRGQMAVFIAKALGLNFQ